MQLQEKKETCLLDNKWVTPNIIYEAEISSNTNDEHKKYLAAAETSFKERYSNYTRDSFLSLNPLFYHFSSKKFFIIKYLDNCNLLNKRSELVSKCRHQNELLLCNVKRNDSID